MKLLSTGNPKLLKGEKKGYLSFVLHLAPANLSGYETCPKRSAGCTHACLNTSGRGGIIKKGETSNVIQDARIRKTIQFFNNRSVFMADLVKDVQAGIKQAAKKDMIPAFRLNGTSDLAWERYPVEVAGVTYPNIMTAFPEVQFYDYTAVVSVKRFEKIAALGNYHLTVSAKEDNQADVQKALDLGFNVAMVFNKLPGTFQNKVVHDGDDTDLRFLDPAGVIVGLKAKGKAKKDTSGFVRMIPVGIPVVQA